jgi:hypothetical protein
MIISKKTGRIKEVQQLNFIIDKLTNSIENIRTKESFETLILPLTATDLKTITKANGWKFDWKTEVGNKNKMVRKLVINNAGNKNIIHGLISISLLNGYVEMNLIENAPFNLGKQKEYNGVAGNLVAYACEVSFANGFEGYVSFVAKTDLIQHYFDTLKADILFGNKMVIETNAAKKLVSKYFKDYFLNK